MTRNVGSDDAAVETVVIINGELAVYNRVDHVVINPAKIGAGCLPFSGNY